MGLWGSPVCPIPRSGNGLSSGVEEAVCEEVGAWVWVEEMPAS